MTDETAELHPPGLTMSRREALQATAGAVAFAALPLPPEAAADSTATPAPPTHTLPLEVTVNGRVHQLVVDPRLSVLDMLRERLSLTGTKKGCNQGACGACTVLIDGQRVNACLALAVMYDGAKITTIEGVAEGEALHPLQVAFIEHDAFQCGYCTSGQIMSGLGCISEGHASSAEEISYWMSGNICRCGAYPGIVAAVAQAAKEDRT
ncbi:(2Fe-2S)-binding protein [Sinorhizobium meliloti]|uniref:(2Fe-2S)-binding protein n=1 Tax=Rhizobium meliloti TaxID=382 RepID=UPI00036C1B26|nr:(2Fe-2S)-binding protein [Sinorhizobium meliloti]MDE4552337.1 (2Fe-2S)-binding protein [Sinorhizobium meliloti]RVH07254.1 (2Fe-2S)-binding protein [Sinorhizobium meliloti]RVL90653.1 (2Fe-2S)-binding protein [Sinorhizobium meliloti]